MLKPFETIGLNSLTLFLFFSYFLLIAKLIIKELTFKYLINN